MDAWRGPLLLSTAVPCATTPGRHAAPSAPMTTNALTCAPTSRAQNRQTESNVGIVVIKMPTNLSVLKSLVAAEHTRMPKST